PMKQQNHRRILRTCLAIKDGKPIDLHCAIPNLLLHDGLLFLSVDSRRERERNGDYGSNAQAHRASSEMQSCSFAQELSPASRITSSSPGIPNGRLPTPITMRAAMFSAQKISRNRSDAPSATPG